MIAKKPRFDASGVAEAFLFEEAMAVRVAILGSCKIRKGDAHVKKLLKDVLLENKEAPKQPKEGAQ